MKNIRIFILMAVSNINNICRPLYIIFFLPDSEFLWLKAKLSRHHKALQIQKEMTEKCNQYLKAFPPVKKVLCFHKKYRF